MPTLVGGREVIHAVTAIVPATEELVIQFTAEMWNVNLTFVFEDEVPPGDAALTVEAVQIGASTSLQRF